MRLLLTPGLALADVDTSERNWNNSVVTDPGSVDGWLNNGELYRENLCMTAACVVTRIQWSDGCLSSVRVQLVAASTKSGRYSKDGKVRGRAWMGRWARCCSCASTGTCRNCYLKRRGKVWMLHSWYRWFHLNGNAEARFMLVTNTGIFFVAKQHASLCCLL